MSVLARHGPGALRFLIVLGCPGGRVSDGVAVRAAVRAVGAESQGAELTAPEAANLSRELGGLPAGTQLLSPPRGKDHSVDIPYHGSAALPGRPRAAGPSDPGTACGAAEVCVIGWGTPRSAPHPARWRAANLRLRTLAR